MPRATLWRVRFLAIRAILSAVLSLAAVAALPAPSRDQSGVKSQRDHDQIVTPGSDREVLVPPNDTDPGIDMGAPRRSEFPMPVIPPPVNNKTPGAEKP